MLFYTSLISMRSRLTAIPMWLNKMRVSSTNTCYFICPFTFILCSFLFYVSSCTFITTRSSRCTFTLPLYTISIVQSISSSTFWITTIRCWIIYITIITEWTCGICTSSMKSLTWPSLTISYVCRIFHSSYCTSICRLSTLPCLRSRLMSDTVYILVMSTIISSTLPAPSIWENCCIFIKVNYCSVITKICTTSI